MRGKEVIMHIVLRILLFIVVAICVFPSRTMTRTVATKVRLAQNKEDSHERA